MTTSVLFIHPGDVYFGDEVNELSTILGSCVAVTLWHPMRKIVGLCHVQFPTETKSSNDYRYAENAILYFVENISQCNTTPSQFDVEVYGGGNMFSKIFTDRKETVGDKNIIKVLKCLEENGFEIKKTDLGGAEARKLRINRLSGMTKLEYVKAQQQ